jgi:ornithine carbamoyltransferase
VSQTPRHFLDLWKLEGSDLRAILEDAKRRKAASREKVPKSVYDIIEPRNL